MLQSAFRTVIEWLRLRQRSRAQRSLTAKRSTLLCAGAKSSTHEWPRTARHGAGHVCPARGCVGRSHAHGFAPFRTRRTVRDSGVYQRLTSAPVKTKKIISLAVACPRLLALLGWLLHTYIIEKYIRSYYISETTNM